jgi:hypothetical protein
MTSEVDVRVYALECQVQAPLNAASAAITSSVASLSGASATTTANPVLEFKVPARQKIRQNIPIVNPTEENWTFRVSISGEHFTGAGSVGSGSGEVVVPPKSTIRKHRNC